MAHFAAAWLVPMFASVQCRFQDGNHVYDFQKHRIPRKQPWTCRENPLTHSHNSKNLSETSAAAELDWDPCVIAVSPSAAASLHDKRRHSFLHRSCQNRSLSKQKLLHSSRRSAYTALNRS